MSFKNRIRCAIHCICGKPTIYGSTFVGGSITAKLDEGYIMDCNFHNDSRILSELR